MTHIDTDHNNHQEDHHNDPHNDHQQGTAGRADTRLDHTGGRATVNELRHRINRLEIILTATRRAYADLRAAARATLAADRDGEPDPLCYLRDELTDPVPPREGSAPQVPNAGRGGAR